MFQHIRNDGLNNIQRPKRPQVGKIVLPEQDSPFNPFPGTEIYIPEKKGPIIEVPYEFPNHFPDWSKRPLELPPGVPDQGEVELPSGPTVPDWSKGPLEVPYPNTFPGPAELPGPNHIPGPAELPTFPGQTPGEIWLLNS